MEVKIWDAQRPQHGKLSASAFIADIINARVTTLTIVFVIRIAMSAGGGK